MTGHTNLSTRALEKKKRNQKKRRRGGFFAERRRESKNAGRGEGRLSLFSFVDLCQEKAKGSGKKKGMTALTHHSFVAEGKKDRTRHGTSSVLEGNWYLGGRKKREEAFHSFIRKERREKKSPPFRENEVQR